MTTKTQNLGPWQTAAERGRFKIRNLRNILSKFTQESEGLSEIVMGSEKPILIKRTETDDIIVELSAAYKSAISSPSELEKWEKKSPGQANVKEIKEFFQELDAPAVTTEEVANTMGYLPSEAFKLLLHLEHRGWVSKKKSGSTTIWWPGDSLSDTGSEDLDIFPEFIKQGLEESEEDITNWIKEHQRENESLNETYDRIRGNPDLEDAKRLISGDQLGEVHMMENIRRKREKEKERKDNLQNLFG